MRALVVHLACFLLVTACSSTPDENASSTLPEEKPLEQLYNEALDASKEGNLGKAERLFEEVDRQYPFSPWATKAQLMLGFTLYEDLRYDEAIVALERFIELHPAHEDVPYAYYLRALSLYEQISDVGRDQLMTKEALDALQQVTRRFPGTKYSRDAQLKIDLTRDHLAGKEMEVGRFYQKRGDHLAAINRFKIVVDDFQTTTHIPESLHRLTESYLALGLRDEAGRNAAVLGHNYPGSKWYEYSYELLN